ncbi:MAG: hypothetical protein ACE5JC_06005 [Candidatus Zixiibacteriota bacterium]
MLVQKGRLLLLVALAVLLTLGMTPIAQANVEMEVQPRMIRTHPGGEVNFTLAIYNHDRVGYHCALRPVLRFPDGGIIHLPEINFMLHPHQIIRREVTRRVPRNAPLGEYMLMFHLYDLRTGEMLTHAGTHILVERPPL